MRTHLEFRSVYFSEPEEIGNSYNPHIQGVKLSRFLSEEFKALGYSGRVIEEDWGWIVELSKTDFELWLGCASYEDEASWLVFIEPRKPFVRKWFRKIDTRPAVGKAAEQLEHVLINKGSATHLMWWSDQDSGRK